MPASEWDLQSAGRGRRESQLVNVGYFFLAWVESRGRNSCPISTPTPCPGNRGDLLIFSMVAVSCTQSSQGDGGVLCVRSQRCTVSIAAGTQMCVWQVLPWSSHLWSKKRPQVCVQCCAPGTCIWEGVGICACGFGNCSVEGMSPVLCGSTTC